MVDAQDGVFPLPGMIGTLYAIGADQWAAINAQAAVVVEAQQLSQLITRVIPDYPALLQVCAAWRPTTYPALLAQAVLVGTFAGGVPALLVQLKQDVAALADGDALPASQQFLWRVQFEALANHAATVETSVAALTPAIGAFVAQNEAADAVLARIASSLPPDWQSIAGPLSGLSGGFAALQNGWSGISARLQALAGGRVSFATAGDVRAAVAAATPAWTALNESAIAFDQHATAGSLS